VGLLLDELKKWSYHRKLIQENKELSEIDKERIFSGLCHIKRIFGEGFLETVVEEHHPILGYFRNFAPWTRFWLKEFGDMLSTLEESSGFERIRRKLASKENFSSAISELEIAYRFKIAGFSVELYPKCGRYECDLKAQKPSKEVYVEVSNIGPSEEERKTSYTLNELTKSYIFDPEVQIAGKIYKRLSHPRIAEIKREINSYVKEAKKKQECFEVSHPGIVDIIVCPRSLSARAHKWLKQKGIRSSFEGPSCDVDEIRRVRKTFRDENRQLPKNKPGLIAIFHDNIIIEGDAESYRELSYEIEEEIYEHSNLVDGVLIFPHFVGSDEASSHETDFAWSRRTRYRLGGENTLVIKNKYSRFKIDEEIVQALIASNS
jgi:hypothetical protein